MYEKAELFLRKGKATFCQQAYSLLNAFSIPAATRSLKGGEAEDIHIAACGDSRYHGIEQHVTWIWRWRAVDRRGLQHAGAYVLRCTPIRPPSPPPLTVIPPTIPHDLLPQCQLRFPDTYRKLWRLPVVHLLHSICNALRAN